MTRLAPEERRRCQGFSVSPAMMRALDAILTKRLAAGGHARPKRGGRKGKSWSAILDDAIRRQAEYELTAEELAAVYPPEA